MAPKLPRGAKRVGDGKIEYRGQTFPGLNKPIASQAKGKKKAVLASNGKQVKLVNFGAEGYGHNYSAAARKSYLARSAGIKDGSGKATKDNPLSPNALSRRFLWAGKGGSKKSPPKR